jgi:hypothetical protein
LILPYLERTALADSIDRATHALLDSNQVVAATMIPMYRCPSYRGSDFSQDDRYAALDQKLTIGNYAALGASTVGNLWGAVLDPDGVITPGGKIAPADVTDGLSHTVFIVETREETLAAWADGLTAAVSALAFDPFRSPRYAANQISLNHVPYYEYGEIVSKYGPSSMHPGGAFHLLGDGSVRFVRDDVASAVYVALTTRDGEELLQSVP